MRLIEAASLIDHETRARDAGVVGVDYEIVLDRAEVVVRINFAAGPPLVVTVDLSRPVTEETLPRDSLSKVLAPLLAVH